MPGAVIGSLRVTLGLDGAQFSSGTLTAEKRAEAFGRKVGVSMRGAASEVAKFGAAFLGLGAVFGAEVFANLASQSLEYAASLAETAQQLGVTTKDLQEYRYAATQVGISQEEMDKGLSKLTVTMGKARDGATGPVAAFKELSALLGKDILSSAQTAGDAIPLIADALSKIEDPAKRARLEVELFGKTGQKLDTLLAGGSAQVNQLRDAAEDLGIVLSEDQIQNADATADKLTELKTVLAINIAGVVSDNAKAIYDLVSSLEGLIAKAPAAINFFGKLIDRAKIYAGYASAGQGLLRGDQQQFQRGIAFVNNAKADLDRRNKFDPDFARRFGRLATNLRNGTRPSSGRRAAGAGETDEEKSAKRSAGRSAAAGVKRAAADSKRAADKAGRDERRYEQELARSRDDELSARLDLTVGATARAALEHEQLFNETQARGESIRTNKDLTEAQRQQLLAENAKLQLLKADVINHRENEALAREALQSAQSRLDNDQDVLQAQLSLARTTKERRRIELLILDAQFAQLRLAQQAILDSKESTQQQKTDATDRLKTIDQLEGLARERSKRDNMGPIERYLESIPKGADEINESLESVAANGLGDVIDGLADAATGARSLASVFEDVSNQIIRALIKIAIQKAILGPLQKALGLGAGDGGQSVFDAVTKGAGSVQVGVGTPPIAGFRAGGGPVVGGRNYVVGESGIEIFRPHGSGTIVSNDNIGTGGGGGTSGGIMEIRLRDQLLDARIVSGAAKVTQAGIAQDRQDQSKYAQRRLGR